MPDASALNRPLALLVAATFFMENLDGTIISTAAPAMAHDLGTRPVAINAAMTSYLVTLAIGIPISGWLTDRFGARRVFSLAIVVFTVASALCALSPDLVVLCAMRVVQGAGGAMMVPVGRLIVLRSTQKRDLLAATAYLTWPALVAPVIAPLLGGWLTSVASWHWIFWLNVPLGVAALVAALRLVVDPPRAGTPAPDLVGFLTAGGAAAALLIGLESFEGTGPVPWSRVAVLLAMAVLLGGWCLHGLRHRRHPLLDLGGYAVATFRVANAGGALYRLLIFSAPFLLPLMFQVGYGWSATRSGALVMTLFLGNVAIKPVTTPLIRWLGFRSVIWWSCVGGAACFLGCALIGPATPLPLIVALLVLSGVFRSVGFTGYNSVQFADIPAAGMGAANTLSATVQQLAAGLGVAVGALVLRASEAVTGSDGEHLGEWRLTFVVLAALMLIPAVEVLRGLRHDAGDEVAAGR
ncbi:MAG: MFS transporter [Nocardioides sp.]|uniref:MFS transporter n=1 Tax=Nocardioides sp. TaxID=35761 RepID=UPI0039E42030